MIFVNHLLKEQSFAEVDTYWHQQELLDGILKRALIMNGKGLNFFRHLL